MSEIPGTTKKEPDVVKYHCGYCGNDFEKIVRKANSNSSKGKKSCSDQVKCSVCGNFQRTWNHNG
jgi:hypothetical protein